MPLEDTILLHRILKGTTKEPISQVDWIDYMRSKKRMENTLFYMAYISYKDLYHFYSMREEKEVPLNSPVYITEFKPIEGMVCIDFIPRNQFELFKWSRDMCDAIYNTYIKEGSLYKIKIPDNLKKSFYEKYSSGHAHPNIFNDIAMDIDRKIHLNDLTEFKEKSLDRNIENRQAYLRLAIAIILFALSAALFYFIITSEASLLNYYRLLGLPLLFLAFLSFLQYKYKFCVLYADAHKRNTKGWFGAAEVEDEFAVTYQRCKATHIKRLSALFSTLVMLLVLAVPPYNWHPK